MKKTLFLLAAALIALSVAVPAFADGNPFDPPGSGLQIKTVLRDGNPFDPPGSGLQVKTILHDGNPFDPPASK